MRSANSISDDIYNVEGFPVIFLDADGADASSKRVVDYPYQRAARGTWSVKQWKQDRFAAAYPEFNVEVIDPDGNVVHGRTLLDNIRQSWISAAEEEFEEEDESDVEGPIEITKLRTVASMKEQPKVATKTSVGRGASLSVDELNKFWDIANDLRKSLDAAEYKHIVLGLVFLKYISDTFEEHRAKLLAGEEDYAGANPEDPDEYKAENVFWVPADARWSHLQANAKQPTIGKFVDDAMVAIERDNPRLKGVCPKDYARPGLDKHRLG